MMDTPPMLGQPSKRPGQRLSTARWTLLVATLVSLALWYIPGAALVLYPVRIFVTLIHESGHALVTLLTGGAVAGMAIRPDTSGVTISQDGMPFFIFMAGYVGATAFGALCLQLVRKPGNGRRGLVLLAAVVLVATGLWLRPFGAGAFGFVMGLGIAGLLLVAARWLREPQAAFLTAFLAVQLCLDAVFDLRDLLWMTAHTAADNDAAFMARAFGLTPWFWALLWAACAAAILGVGLRSYWRNSR